MRALTLAAALYVIVAANGFAQDLSGTLSKVDQSGTIAIGHRETSVPFSFRDSDGHIVGYSIDLCLRVVDAIREELDAAELAVKFVPVNPDNRISRVVDGSVDLECGSTTRTLQREEHVDFSLISFITGTRLLVKADGPVGELEDLVGSRLAAPSGSTNIAAIGDLISASALDIDVVEVTDHQEGFDLLNAGEVDAYATDHVLLHGLVSQAAKPAEFAVVGRFLSYDPYALMMRRDDSAFRLVVDRTLARLFRSGEIFQLYGKWFDPMGVPTNVLLEAAFAIQAIPE